MDNLQAAIDICSKGIADMSIQVLHSHSSSNTSNHRKSSNETSMYQYEYHTGNDGALASTATTHRESRNSSLNGSRRLSTSSSIDSHRYQQLPSLSSSSPSHQQQSALSPKSQTTSPSASAATNANIGASTGYTPRLSQLSLASSKQSHHRYQHTVTLHGEGINNLHLLMMLIITTEYLVLKKCMLSEVESHHISASDRETLRLAIRQLSKITFRMCPSVSDNYNDNDMNVVLLDISNHKTVQSIMDTIPQLILSVMAKALIAITEIVPLSIQRDLLEIYEVNILPSFLLPIQPDSTTQARVYPLIKAIEKMPLINQIAFQTVLQLIAIDTRSKALLSRVHGPLLFLRRETTGPLPYQSIQLSSGVMEDFILNQSLPVLNNLARYETPIMNDGELSPKSAASAAAVVAATHSGKKESQDGGILQSATHHSHSSSFSTGGIMRMFTPRTSSSSSSNLSASSLSQAGRKSDLSGFSTSRLFRSHSRNISSPEDIKNMASDSSAKSSSSAAAPVPPPPMATSESTHPIKSGANDSRKRRVLSDEHQSTVIETLRKQYLGRLQGILSNKIEKTSSMPLESPSQQNQEKGDAPAKKKSLLQRSLSAPIHQKPVTTTPATTNNSAPSPKAEAKSAPPKPFTTGTGSRTIQHPPMIPVPPKRYQSDLQSQHHPPLANIKKTNSKSMPTDNNEPTQKNEQDNNTKGSGDDYDLL